MGVGLGCTRLLVLVAPAQRAELSERLGPEALAVDVAPPVMQGDDARFPALHGNILPEGDTARPAPDG